MKTKTDAERIEHLKKLGLKTEGTALAAVPQAPPVHQVAAEDKPIALAPPGMDPRAMPVNEITFDPRLLEKFPSLEGEGMNAASQYVWSLYKSYKGPNSSERNQILHRKISTFISTVRLQRKTGGAIKEKVKTTAEQRDLAQVIAAAGITAEDLAKLIKERK